MYVVCIDCINGNNVKCSPKRLENNKKPNHTLVRYYFTESFKVYNTKRFAAQWCKFSVAPCMQMLTASGFGNNYAESHSDKNRCRS